MMALEAEPGDLFHVSDARWWLGGFRSVRAKAGHPTETDEGLILSRATLQRGNLRAHRSVRVEKIL